MRVPRKPVEVRPKAAIYFGYYLRPNQLAMMTLGESRVKAVEVILQARNLK